MEPSTPERSRASSRRSLEPLPQYPTADLDGDPYPAIEPVPPLTLAGQSAPGTPASELPTARGPPPGTSPPRSGAPSEVGSLGSRGQNTPKGPVKWVPHTHSNPAHAKFCYMCLHGRLEEADKIEEKPGEEGPSETDMKQRGYLHSEKCERVGMDFQKNNLSASWAQSLLSELTAEQTDMVLKFNTQLLRQNGEHAWLYADAEEEQDFTQLIRMFTLTTAEEEHLEDMCATLGNFCLDSPPFAYEPPGGVDGDNVLDSYPPCGKLSHWQLSCIRFQPLLDFTNKLMQGQRGQHAKSLVDSLDQMVHAVLGSPTAGLPFPWLEPDKGEEVVPHAPQLEEGDVPTYEPMKAPPPELPEIVQMGSPFPEKELYQYAFVETEMPEFSVELANPQYAATRCPPTWMLHPSWGKDPEKELAPLRVPPILDQHLWPPLEIQDHRDLRKRKVLRRGLWEAELYTEQGKLLPDLIARTHALPVQLNLPQYKDEEIPLELQGTSEVMETLLPLHPVRSLVKFYWPSRPLPFADCLMDLVRKDFSGANFLAVIEQRYDALKVLREDHRREEMRQQRMLEEKLRLEEEARNAYAKEAEEVFAQVEREEEPETADAAPEGDILPGLLSQQPGTGVEAPEEEDAADDEDAVPADAAAPAAETEVAAPATAGDPSPAAIPPEGKYAGLQELLAAEKQKLSVENLLMDSIFVERLAEKIVGKLGFLPAGLGAQSSLGGSISGTARGDNASGPATVMLDSQVRSHAAPQGDLSQAKGFSGLAMTQQRAAQPPAFGPASLSPRDAAGALPVAMQGPTPGGLAASQVWAQGAPTIPGYIDAQGMPAGAKDVDEYTEEKMRGDSYIRLLTKINPRVGEGKMMKPFRGETIEPSAKLLIKTKYNLEKVVQEGEEDEFAEMDRSHAILFSFVRHNRYEAVESLLQEDESLLVVRDDAENSLLHLACQNNHRRIVKMLLKQRADIDAKNRRGNTPLHYCYAYGFSALAEYLVTIGADETITNTAGLRPPEGLGEEAQGESGLEKLTRATRAG